MEYLGIKRSILREQCLPAFVVLLACFLVSIARSIYWLVSSLYQYLKSDVSNIAIFIAIVCEQMAIFTWIEIATEDNFTMNSDGEATDAFYIVYSKTTKIEKYKTLMALVILMWFIRIIRFFSFSKHLSMFSDIIKRSSLLVRLYLVSYSALTDIIFFYIIFFTLICSYAIIGNILFGISEPDFKTVSESIMTMILVSVGGKHAFSVDTEKTLVHAVFSITFIYCILILVIMMAAIISSHYFELRDGTDQSNSLLQIITSILADFHKLPDDEVDELGLFDRLTYRIKSKIHSFMQSIEVKKAFEVEKFEPTHIFKQRKEIIKGINPKLLDLALKHPSELVLNRLNPQVYNHANA